MGTLQWELELSLLLPRHQVSVPWTKPLGFYDRDDVSAWAAPGLAVIAIPTTLLACWARGWGDLELCIFLTVLQRYLRDKRSGHP